MTTELAVEPPVYVETVPPPVHVKPDQRENAIPDESSMPSSQRPATPRQEDRFDDVVVTTRPPSRGDSGGQTDERQIVQTSSLLAPGILAGEYDPGAGATRLTVFFFFFFFVVVSRGWSMLRRQLSTDIPVDETSPPFSIGRIDPIHHQLDFPCIYGRFLLVACPC
ncbi:PREDICTED: uncharacterized protein LOC106807316 [Priapulus caudatus]|uniref:Uncharacterized protein LOC106807316 n=1 Tax=Priapulus caudatus TaxID=37621 RepID=A0ABM1DYU1_PRICU|nr:PREDICTED: uncharacterized protein LOC106807316 [Priapulus caudatus]